MRITEVEIRARLEAIGEQDGKRLEIGEAALLLAKLDLPKKNLAGYLGELKLIASDLGEVSRGANNLPDQIAALSEAIFKRHGYRGDVEAYDDPQNANLIHVIDRRKGLPVALGILLIHAGRSQGWDISGLNFPGHFLLRLSKSGEHALVDPFDDARPLIDEDLQQLFERIHGRQMGRQPEFMQSVSDRDILVRLQNNIKIRALGDGDRKRAIEVLASIILIAPTRVDILTELALLEASEGNYRSALGQLDRFIERNPESENAPDVLSLKETLKRRLN